MSRRMGLWWVVPMLVVGAMRVHAQAEGGEPLTRAPRFLVASATSSRPMRADVNRTPMLRQRISVAFDGVSLRVALAAIAEKSGMKLDYSDAVVPLKRTVRLTADDITVAAALTVVLLDADVDVMLERMGRATLVRRSTVGDDLRVAPGTIVGRVTDAKTGDPLVGTDVLVEGTKFRTTSGDKGYYRLNDVEAGTYTLVARRVGYAKQSRSITVTAMQEVTVDLALQSVVTQLNELVTTVTGEQRRLELGHVVGVINADSLVKEAPVTNISELLAGRVPGLQVFQSQGTVGGEVKLRIRGANSLLLNNEPIVIVDGVRYTTAAAQRAFVLGPGSENTSPLNDLNPNDIASIEVVKGPSASTLYGTDASNGVIVITTKRGMPGPARWNAYVKSARSDIPVAHYPDNYRMWGTFFGTPNQSCPLYFLALGYCTQDSLTVMPNPLNDASLSIFGHQPRWESGLNVAGGRQDLQYYFSGDFENALGAIRMPPEFEEQLKEQRGISELPEDLRDPNRLTKVNLRASMTAGLGSRAEFRVNSGYIKNNTRNIMSYFNPYRSGTMTQSPGRPYGNDASPEQAFAQTSTERTDRFVASGSLDWHPAPWLLARATGGLDLGSRSRTTLAPRGAVSCCYWASGSVAEDRVRQVATTGDVGLTASLRRGRVSSRTSIGAQYVRNLADGISSVGLDLPPGGTSVSQAAEMYNGQSYVETVTLGSYLEQTFGINDRLFLTGAVRVDGASAFGQNYDAAAYPKVSASWLASDEPFFPRLPGLEEFRLRYAYGASGQQPNPSWSRAGYGPNEGVLNGSTTTVIGLTSLGNPDLRPERVREHEFGFDASGLQHRLRVGLTWYHRRTVDQIASLALPTGFGSVYTNLGLTTQHGFEAELAAQVVDRREISLDLTFQHGLHRTKLVDAAGALPKYMEGYPLGARFGRPVVGFSDTNGDNILTPGEVQVATTAVYLGESTAPQTQTLTAVVGFFDRRVRLSALFERQGGFQQVDAIKQQQCSTYHCRELNDPATPLAEQALAIAAANYSSLVLVESGDFTRFREINLALDLPVALSRALRVRSATVSFSGRNIALWSKFSGPDPESSRVTGAGSGFADGIPQGRTWTARLDLGL